MKLIGVCGMAGSGKDTFADFLVRDHGWVKIALADPLKRFCQEVFDFSDEQLWGPSEKRNAPDRRYVISKGYEEVVKRFEATGDLERAASYAEQAYLTPRYALQQLGTEWGRRCYPDVWVKLALRNARDLLRPVDDSGLNGFGNIQGVVISDVRFKNEVAAIQDAGGTVVRLLRGAPLPGEAGRHQSETEVQEIPDSLFDHVIDNREFTLEELRQAAGRLVGLFARKKSR